MFEICFDKHYLVNIQDNSITLLSALATLIAFLN